MVPSWTTCCAVWMATREAAHTQPTCIYANMRNEPKVWDTSKTPSNNKCTPNHEWNCFVYSHGQLDAAVIMPRPGSICFQFGIYYSELNHIAVVHIWGFVCYCALPFYNAQFMNRVILQLYIFLFFFCDRLQLRSHSININFQLDKLMGRTVPSKPRPQVRPWPPSRAVLQKPNICYFIKFYKQYNESIARGIHKLYYL